MLNLISLLTEHGKTFHPFTNGPVKTRSKYGVTIVAVCFRADLPAMPVRLFVVFWLVVPILIVKRFAYASLVLAIGILFMGC